MQTTSTEIDGLKVLLGAHTCLILDPSKTSALNVRSALRLWGMAAGRIFIASTSNEAEALLDEHKPTIFILDFQAEALRAHRLIEKFELMHPESRRVALVTTSVESTPFVSDGQVDAHFAKPFNLDTLRRTLLKTMIAKFYPDSYMRKVLVGDDFARAGEEAKAVAAYDTARAMNASPLRALRGLAQLHQNHGRFEEALKFFKQARECSPADYKTINGEFEMLLKLGDLKGAAQLVPTLRVSFPQDSMRLQNLFDTVTRAERFDELVPLLKTYRDLHEKTDQLIAVVQRSFFTAGQLALSTSELVAAKEYFEIGFQVAAKRFDFVEFVVREFLKNDLRAEAEAFLAKALPEDVGSAAYRRVCFELDCLILPVDQLLDRGRRLIFEGHGSPEIFEKLVALFAAAGKQTMAEAVISKATESFPALRTSLYQVLVENLPKEESFRRAA